MNYASSNEQLRRQLYGYSAVMDNMFDTMNYIDSTYSYCKNKNNSSSSYNNYSNNLGKQYNNASCGGVSNCIGNASSVLPQIPKFYAPK